MISRRSFIRRAAGLSAGIALQPWTHGWAHSAAAVRFDLHAHPGLFPARGLPGYGGDNGVAKTIGEMKSGKVTGAFFSLVADLPNIKPGPAGIELIGGYEKGAGWKEYQRQLANFRELLVANQLTVARSAKDLDLAGSKGTVAVFLASEGGDFLEGSSERVSEMAANGVRSIQLVHYHPNELGDLQTENPAHQGLSAAGKEVVRKMNASKILIDVAHASFETTKAVCELTTQPVMLSHSILQAEGSRPLSRRAITPQHAKIVAATGGVIGAWPSGFNTSFDDFVDNTLRLVDVAGIDHVGLGTDIDGNFKPVLSSYLQLDDWRAALLAKGMSAAEADQVLGGNARRVINQVIG
ncbi:MAG: membrane dipeptidase [Cyclobacteriaceae bacterium]